MQKVGTLSLQIDKEKSTTKSGNLNTREQNTNHKLTLWQQQIRIVNNKMKDQQ